jgi:molybdate transport repressor ModE-like protein
MVELSTELRIKELFMDTNELRYFAAVAKYGSISQAAKAIFISQPQLSHIIRKLENEMGVTLFRRTSHGTRLTADGQRILVHCQVILKEMDRLQLMVSARKVERSCLNVSMTRFSHTAECFNEVCRRYQDIDSFTGRLHEASPLEVINDVKEGKSNLGVIHTAVKKGDEVQDFSEQGLEYIPLAVIRPYVCISSEHELVRTVGRRGIDIRELMDYGFVRYIGQYEDFIYHLTTESGPIDLNMARKVVRVNDRQEQMRLLSRTNFFTIGIMEFKDQDSLYGVISVPLLGCEERFAFGVIKRKGTEPSQMEQDFIVELQKRYKKMQQLDSAS